MKVPTLIANSCQDAFLHFLVTGREPIICRRGTALARICTSYRQAVSYFGKDKRPLQKNMATMQPPAFFAAYGV